MDHAKLGAEILEREKVLDHMMYEDKELILGAIRNHNMVRLPYGLGGGLSFLSKLLRDADKVDIPHVITDCYKSREGNDNPSLINMLPDPLGPPRMSLKIYTTRG